MVGYIRSPLRVKPLKFIATTSRYIWSTMHANPLENALLNQVSHMVITARQPFKIRRSYKYNVKFQFYLTLHYQFPLINTSQGDGPTAELSLRFM
jgi:hypothetical protein